jgi:hypothetical protein
VPIRRFVSHPPRPHPTNEAELPKRKVQRYSPDRLLREKITVPASSTLSTEKHRGRIMLRVESSENPR